MKIASKVESRLVQGLKNFLPIVSNAKSRDAGEADTSTIVKDMLSDVFGYDKYTEITSEFQIRGTYCDLAIKIAGKLQLLIEVKAIGFELKEQHVKQAVDYAANQGIEWVLLTNAANWRIYHITFEQPIQHDLIAEIDFLSADPKNDAHINSLYIITKEGSGKSALESFHAQKLAMSKFYIGEIMTSDAVLQVVRRELRRINPEAKINADELRQVVLEEVIKRDIFEGDKASEARRRVQRSQSRALREAKSAEVNSTANEPVALASANTPAP